MAEITVSKKAIVADIEPSEHYLLMTKNKMVYPENMSRKDIADMIFFVLNDYAFNRDIATMVLEKFGIHFLNGKMSSICSNSRNKKWVKSPEGLPHD